MLLRCPGCGSEERVGTITGSWLVVCGECGQVARLVGLGRECVIRSLQCALCGYGEENVQIPRERMGIICPECGHVWNEGGG